jgi:hypothetical protein
MESFRTLIYFSTARTFRPVTYGEVLAENFDSPGVRGIFLPR